MFAIQLLRNNGSGYISEVVHNDLGGEVKTYVRVEPVGC
jgi:hypothetical protein